MSKNQDKEKDTCLALILLCVILWWAKQSNTFIFIIAGLALLGAVLPGALKPVSMIWFSLSEKIGLVSSKIVLMIVYYFVITPIGLLKKLKDKDENFIKNWKTVPSSFVDHTKVSRQDLENQF